MLYCRTVRSSIAETSSRISIPDVQCNIQCIVTNNALTFVKYVGCFQDNVYQYPSHLYNYSTKKCLHHGESSQLNERHKQPSLLCFSPSKDVLTERRTYFTYRKNFSVNSLCALSSSCEIEITSQKFHTIVSVVILTMHISNIQNLI
jgi:hypothetical protein